MAVRAEVGDQEQQIVLLHPDVAEEGHGSSLEVPQMWRDCLLTSAGTGTSIFREDIHL